MQLTNIGLWASNPNDDDEAEPIVMDYNIDPERSDQILAVKLDLGGKIIGIDWES